MRYEQLGKGSGVRLNMYCVLECDSSRKISKYPVVQPTL